MASNSIKTYKVTCAVANTAYSVLTGTIVAPTLAQAGGFNHADKGRAVTFQCQTTGAVATIGGSDIITNAGINIAGSADGSGGGYSPPGSDVSAVIQIQDWWVSSDTAGAVVVAQLVKHV